MTTYEMIIIYNREWFATPAQTVQEAVADLFDYVGGKILGNLFRKTVIKLSVEETVELYGQLASEVPINMIFTGCSRAKIREVGLEAGEGAEK